MNNLLEELLIFGNCENNSVLDDGAGIFKAYENQDEKGAIQAEVKLMRDMLAMASRYGFAGNLWKSCIAHFIAFQENPFSLQAERRISEQENVFVRSDCCILRKLFHYDFTKNKKFRHVNNFSQLLQYKSDIIPTDEGQVIENLKAELDKAADDEAFYQTVNKFYQTCGTGTFGLNRAFMIKEKDGTADFEPVKGIEDITLDDLVGYEVQKKMLVENTEAFLRGKPANNALLYGDGGTGKSTSIRAILNQYYGEGLRMIQVYRHQMQYLTDIISKIKNRNYRFIIYMDDLSFEDFETEYKYLKAVIEGGLEPRPENVLIYATSNRRHFIKETWNDRNDVEHTGEIFRSDSIEEKRSLADRFGVQIYYGKPSKEEYHHIIDILAENKGVKISKEKLHAEATKWEIRHGGVSGRSAKQFVDHIKGMEE